MLRLMALLIPGALWLFLMRDFIFGTIPVNMDTNTIYGVAKYYFNNELNGVIPLWEPFVTLGRPFYAAVICNLFNPITQLIPLLKIAGLDYAHGFIVYMVVYFFVGCAGFYLLALQIFKDRPSAYLAYLSLMFSSFGASMFTQFTFLEITVPTIWFFLFCLRFYATQQKADFVGMIFACMVLISAYLPFYFITVLLCFCLLALCLYFNEMKAFSGMIFSFVTVNWRLAIFCILGLLLAAAPILVYKSLDASGEVVAPGRHCQYSSAQECYERTMNHQGGMSYAEITRSGTLGERLDMQYLFGHLDKISYGSDSFFVVPVMVFLLVVLGLILPLQRVTILLSGMCVVIGLIALGHASGLLEFCYKHIFFFKYFRNLFFFGAFLLPLLILLAIAQLKNILALTFNPDTAISGLNKFYALWIVIAHLIIGIFLTHYTGVPFLTWVTLGLSGGVMIFLALSRINLSVRFKTAIFALLIVLEPLGVLHAYAFNAKDFASVLPAMHVQPVFNWIRPLNPAVAQGRIYQFVPYEDFWYDMQMTDAPPQIGYPQSITRWTFDLSQHITPNVLAAYAQYKIVLYNQDNPKGIAMKGPSPALELDHFDVNNLTFKTNFQKPTLLVYNDSFTSDWKAYVDGVEVEMLRINTAFKGINVPPSLHQVSFAYAPWGGGFLYVMATLILCFFMGLTCFLAIRRL